MLKTFAAQIVSVTRSRHGRRNLSVLARFFLVLAVMISIYSVAFHLLMLREGQEHTWITGFYWTLTVMSTLGFGDITFHTDVGRLFSILVLFSGMIFLLILLPFTFIEFFYEPWMSTQAAGRAPRQLRPGTRQHVLLTSYDPVTSALIQRLKPYRYQYTLVVPDLDEALRLHDLGLNVMIGDLGDPQTWIQARVESAAMVASTADDVRNTNVAFTVRALAENVPIVTSATDHASVDILKLAGSDVVLRLDEMIGQSFARRSVGGDSISRVVGRFDDLLVAETSAHRTPLVGKMLRDTGLRAAAGVMVLGAWERGRFEPARAETVIRDHAVLVIAGSRESLLRYDDLFHIRENSSVPVVIIGGGRVGQATAKALSRRKLDYRIVEVGADPGLGSAKWVRGSAADLAVLEQAGIRETSTVIITPNDDDLNVYLTIYCRQLRPDVQILSRATNEGNVAKLNRAGADSVLSYASMGAAEVMNILQDKKVMMIEEGLNLFEVRNPAVLAGRTIEESAVRERTECSVVAIRSAGSIAVVPGPSELLPAGADIVLIGTTEAEKRFLEIYGGDREASGTVTP
jgi:Trk K+ transport system NAD-binding subunit